jgi:hypothetical protein
MARYEIRDVVSDYGIYEDGELKLILNSRTNAEYIKAILEHEARHPNAAVPYRPDVADMSDEECLAVFRLCCAEENHCKTCPLNNLGDGCFLHIDRRVLAMAERALGKEIPKKPYLDNDNGIYEKEHCPTCHRSLFPNDHHCRCGQAIDWSKEGEDNEQRAD